MKFKLIRALIETVRSFRQVRRVKVVVALRLDLLQRVISATRDSGFQSEKYESMYLRLRWTESQLIELITKRLGRLIRQRYTSRPVTLEEVFPKAIHRTRFTDFLCQRTALRPRDAILFVNECLARAVDRQQVTGQMVLDAEAAYSEKRVDSLQEEWAGVFPRVSEYLKVLTRKRSSFPASELSKLALEDWVMSSLLTDVDTNDPVVRAARLHFIDGKGSFFEFVLVLLDAMYIVGVIGIKPEPTMVCYWSFHSDHRPASGAIKPLSVVQVHPTFWRALGVKPI